MFEGLNWDNVFIAGGSVVASILPIPEDYGRSDFFFEYFGFVEFFEFLAFFDFQFSF
jgi:hypothetical protein